jgi:RNA ligase
MIHPALIRGELVFMTRKGITDVAMQAMRECDYDADEMIEALERGFTPIYEFISPNNKIVLHYNEPRLVRLNLRHTKTGTYYSDFAETDGPIRNHCVGNIQEILDSIKKASDLEGAVIKFHNNQRFIKFKADDYVAMHKVVDETTQEKNVLALIMDDKLDDVIPLIAKERAEHLKKYADVVNFYLADRALVVSNFVKNRKNLTQKEYAEDVKKLPSGFHSFAFKARTFKDCDIQSIVAMFKEFFKKTLTTQTKVNQWKEFLGYPVFKMPVD